jgi:eukaryotic-like serine/threonine-protein kinase
MAEQLGRFALLNRIGSGGMAEVFLARGPAGMCVVKKMHARIAEDPDLVRMFLDEASLAAQLSHPGIARVFDLGESNGNYYFAMEYVPGFDLYTILEENLARKIFMEAEVAGRIAADLAGALHHAHEAVGARGQKLGIVHRDVSPQNILISTQGQVKLIDFGVARASQKLHQTRAGLVKGKAAYMAPEQVVGAAIDRRVDVYALGLVMFEMLTNHRAIVGEQEMEIILNARAGKLNELTEFRHDIPDQFRTIMMRCLSFRADNRPPTADHVRLELESWLEQTSRPVSRNQLAALLKVVPADPTHHIENEQESKSGKREKLSESTVRPKAPPTEKVGDETLRGSKRVSSEFLMKEFNPDGSRVDREASTDVERKQLGRKPSTLSRSDITPRGPVPEEQDEAPTLFVPGNGRNNGPPTLRNNDPELMEKVQAAGKAIARTERNAPAVTAPPPEFANAPTPLPESEADTMEPDHVTQKPREEQPVSDATLIPRRSRGPIYGVIGVVALAIVGLVYFLTR